MTRHLPCRDCRNRGWHPKGRQEFANGSTIEVLKLCMTCFGARYIPEPGLPDDHDHPTYLGDEDTRYESNIDDDLDEDRPPEWTKAEDPEDTEDSWE